MENDSKLYRKVHLPGSQDSESFNSRQFLDACGIDYATNELLVEYKAVFEKNRQKDPIHVIPFRSDQTVGLISYVKFSCGGEEAVSYVHTLNSGSGFRRKLLALNVVLTDDCTKQFILRQRS